MKRSFDGIPRLNLPPANGGEDAPKIVAPKQFSEGPAIKRQSTTVEPPPAVPLDRRQDAALVLPYRTGSARQALAAVASEEQCALSRDVFENRAVVASTLKSRQARLKVWLDLAERAGVQGPLTPHSVKTVIGALLRAGFRSAAAYFSAAKRHHIETYKSWDVELDLIVSADVGRACKRGLGPPSRSSPFPLLAVSRVIGTNIESAATPASDAGPMHPWPCVVLATWALLREVEVANASLADIRTSRVDKTLTLLAPASKADISALGSSVTLACVCSAGLGPVCPVCIGRAHLSRVAAMYNVTDANELDGKPLFPARNRSWCSKQGMTQAIAALASQGGQTPFTRRGAERWGGHALRRGGVHLYASLGLSREQIKTLARHSSSAIDGYLDGADLQYMKRLLQTRFVLPQTSCTASELAVPSSFPPWTKVKMARGGKVHECTLRSGVTVCGWPWAASVSRCLPAEGTPTSCRLCARRAPRQAASSSAAPPSPTTSSGSSSDCSA